ncbi:hypothetical protein HX109_10980 [Galbibacter sp. BG1]|uniref:hypothetical protein n=1 Tax=Galbibacter sp. BG1 TaxID=1170699 RepID=UPI0015B8773B|nr:hypothetical protein [Galbibacter sp. BG1]QLE02052.1 hypothetical protein HX109_10980 [Galbibacter sp. BG1]
MALLKKIKGSTLMETMIATVLIVVVFMISSLVLNNILFNQIHNNTMEIDNHIRVLEYKILNKQLSEPYSEDFNNWQIEIKKKREYQDSILMITMVNSITKKRLIKKKVIE